MTDSPSPTILLQQLAITNLLSYGPDSEPIVFGPLNVIIGPNGSGKSNLIEIISLIREAPGDLRDVPRRGGGSSEWFWKGASNTYAGVVASWLLKRGWLPLNHSIRFSVVDHSFWLSRELIAYSSSISGIPDGEILYWDQDEKQTVSKDGAQIFLEPGTINHRSSVLSQLRDPINYPGLFSLAAAYDSIRIYREWSFGRNTIFREPQKADDRNDRLEEDFSNLGLFLNRLRRDPKTKRAFLSHLSDLYEGITDFDVIVEGGTVQVFLTEGDYTIPATRLSDGTLRYLCLLAILLDPDPPRLICIEEPELGLHPDIIVKIADLLIDASTRTQLVVTTHTQILIDAMTEHPEAVLVCEKHAGQTIMNRLSRDALRDWLKKYRLGQLWLRGEIGGTRW